MQKTTIIAECGLNHNGDINIAKKLIALAAIAGCNSVKFQKRNPYVCVPEHQKNKPKSTPWGEMTYLEYKLRTEFGKEEYDIIDECCKHHEIEWSASVWDYDSLNFLLKYKVPWIKIPSAHLTNRDLISHAAATHLKLIISTGMSTEEEINTTVKQVRRYHNNFALLHSNSTYPAPINELNLSCIGTLKKKYGCEVGYSGHEFRLGTSVAAIYLGATIIERHITLDRTSWGSDHLSSVEPQGLIKLVKGIRELEDAHGDGVVRVYPGELEKRKSLRGY